MVRMMIVFCMLVFSSLQVYAFEFRTYRSESAPFTGSGLEEIYERSPNRAVFSFWMRPSAHQQPEDSLYKLCAHAHGEYYYSRMPPPSVGSPVDRCIKRQAALADNSWVRDFDRIFPRYWYRVELTNDEVRTYLAYESRGLQSEHEVLSLKIDELGERIDALTEVSSDQYEGLMNEFRTLYNRLDELFSDHRNLATVSQVEDLKRRVDELMQQNVPNDDPIVDHSQSGFSWDELKVWFDEFWNEYGKRVLSIIFVALLVLAVIWILLRLVRRRKADDGSRLHASDSSLEQRVSVLEGAVKTGFEEMTKSVRDLKDSVRAGNSTAPIESGESEGTPLHSHPKITITESWKEGRLYRKVEM